MHTFMAHCCMRVLCKWRSGIIVNRLKSLILTDCCLWSHCIMWEWILTWILANKIWHMILVENFLNAKLMPTKIRIQEEIFSVFDRAWSIQTLQSKIISCCSVNQQSLILDCAFAFNCTFHAFCLFLINHSNLINFNCYAIVWHSLYPATFIPPL